MSDQPVLMNISETSPYLNGLCDLKCDYSFYYHLSTCSVYPYASTGNTSLIFTYENNTNGTKQVLYNGIEYNVGAIYLCSPSTHFFEGNLAEGELQIIHEAVLGNGSLLSVCIPITTSSGSTPNDKGSKLLRDMIINAVNIIGTTEQEMSSFNNEVVNSENMTGNASLRDALKEMQFRYDSVLSNTPQILNIKNYTLENIIPKSPFFSYTDTNANINYIVYDINDAIMVEPNVIQQLQSVISPYYSNPTYNTNGTGNVYQVFFNETGATNLLTTNLSDEIYIDCQPTGSSTEQTNLTTATNESGKTSSVMFSIYVMFFILVLVVIYMLFSYITHPDKKNFSVGNIKNPFT